MPGPGNYSVIEERDFSNGPKFTFSQTTRHYNKNENPGPGSYNEADRLVRAKSGSVRFGSSKRTDIISKSVTELPGPGNYSNTDLETFGKSGV
jgi:hypothetical protein